VIIGRLIPARLDKTEEGYEKLGFKNLLKNKLIESEFLSGEDTSEEAKVDSKVDSEEAKVDSEEAKVDSKVDSEEAKVDSKVDSKDNK
jgi:hypothetical protein